MKFRYARHTNNIEELIYFYTNIIGLNVLGNFENQDNYNGVFLGFKDRDWQIEFTESIEKVKHQPESDDLLVFYFDTQEKIKTVLNNAKKEKVIIKKSKNPY